MNTAVITTGGLGTRMLTFTKSNPKTMLPVYTKSNDSSSIPMFKPLIEYIFDNLYDYGFRRFCIIVGSKTKSAIINHLEPDSKFIKLLKSRNSPEDKRFINALLKLYTKMMNCDIKWITQDTPSGFGDALLGAKNFVKNETFLLHAGDTYFPNYQFLKKFVSMHENSNNSSASILTKKMIELKGYGIAQTKKQKGENIVINLEEKPKKPKSNQAILPLYVFKSDIFNALKNTSKGYNQELQITDAIMTLVKNEKKVLSYNYGINKWFDIGRPSHYFNALTYSYKESLVL
jgi:UTP--glucose-1-phosphate uridylyltransferase